MTDKPTFIALFRGINVGRANRVPMAELRAVVEKLGCTNVRTVLASGNVIFNAAETDCDTFADRIRHALEIATGISTPVFVLTADRFASIVSENPLLDRCDNPSRLLVAIPSHSERVGPLAALSDRDWGPETFAPGSECAYLWCPDGVLKSQLPGAVEDLLGDGLTIRTWSTILRILKAVDSL